MSDKPDKGKKEVPLILINESLCKRCGICSAFCPTKVFDAREDGLPLVARGFDCIWCGLCEMRCPDFAILLKGENEQDGQKEPQGGEPVAKPTANGVPKDKEPVAGGVS